MKTNQTVSCNRKENKNPRPDVLRAVNSRAVAFGLLLSSGLSGVVAQAQNYGGGNGGDPLELRMENIKAEIRNWILATEFKDIDLGGQDAKALAALVEKSLEQSKLVLTDKSLVIGGKERACINYPQTKLIECNRAKLNSESDANLYPLMLHEYMGLAGLEQNQGTESDYKYSKQARDFVEYKMVAKLGVMRKGIGVTSMKFVALPSDTFKLSSVKKWKKFKAVGKNWHSITLSAFEMQMTEVTQQQYFEVMGENPSFFNSKSSCPFEYQEVIGKNGIKMGLCPSFPVETVNWRDADVFAKKVSEILNDGYYYRLPREMEWIYAARAGSDKAYSFGNNETQLKDYAWFNSNSSSQTHSVAGKKPNAFGLYDMHGNVAEWTQSPVDVENLGKESVDPVGSNLWSRPAHGGSWNLSAYESRVLRRTCISAIGDSTGFNLGFRLVRIRQ